jgi:hypothetical protein
VTLTGLNAATFLTGVTLIVASASSTQFTANFSHADYGPTGDNGSVYYSLPGKVLLTSSTGQIDPNLVGNNLIINNINSTFLGGDGSLYLSGYQGVYINGYDSLVSGNGFPVVLEWADSPVFTTTGSGASATGVSILGLLTGYNSRNTVGQGMPAILAKVDSTNNSAAISATNLYTIPVSFGVYTGVYRVSFYAKISQAATTSSTLGGTNGFQLIYTDADSSSSVTTPSSLFSTGFSLTANTTSTVLYGTHVINVKDNSTIQYQMDYSSVGGTPMKYVLHIRVEAI